MSRSSNTHTIACGSCKIAAQSVENPKPDDEVTCPQCSRRDRFDDVIRTVKEHVAYVVQKRLDDTLRGATRGSKFLKVTSKRPGNRSFSWIALGI